MLERGQSSQAERPPPQSDCRCHACVPADYGAIWYPRGSPFTELVPEACRGGKGQGGAAAAGVWDKRQGGAGRMRGRLKCGESATHAAGSMEVGFRAGGSDGACLAVRRPGWVGGADRPQRTVAGSRRRPIGATAKGMQPPKHLKRPRRHKGRSKKALIISLLCVRHMQPALKRSC
jgi:hypothetical protein